MQPQRATLPRCACELPFSVVHVRLCTGMPRHSRGYLEVRVLYGTLRITIFASMYSALHDKKNTRTHSTSPPSPAHLSPLSWQK